MRKVLGVTVIALALAITIIPQFTNCQAQGRLLKLADGRMVPMKCTWTAKAEIATGVPILAVGSIMLFVQKRESLRHLGILGMILGVFVMLLPTSLIGVCNGSMLCNTVMKPSLLTLGSLVTAASLIGVTLSLRRGE